MEFIRGKMYCLTPRGNESIYALSGEVITYAYEGGVEALPNLCINDVYLVGLPLMYIDGPRGILKPYYPDERVNDVISLTFLCGTKLVDVEFTTSDGSIDEYFERLI
jgi:hypothetical protein